MFTGSETAQYIGRFIGFPERLEPQISPWQDRNLPVWATQTAEFKLLRWANGASVLLIVPKTPMTETAIRLSRVVSRITQHPALLVADLLPPQALGVLVREGIPHVLTDRAIYAPQLGTYYKSDLIKEQEVGVLAERLSAAAQKLVVYFLLRGHDISDEWRLNDWSMAFLKEGLEISSSSLSRGFHQLALLEFGHIAGNGPQKKFRFDDRNRVWGRLLQAEVETVIRKGKIPGVPKKFESYVLSSDTALSRMSDLSPTDYSTIAMSQSKFSRVAARWLYATQRSWGLQ